MMEDGLHKVPTGKIASVLTNLEMTAPAPRRAVPAPAGITFEGFRPDVDEYRDLFTRVGGTDWLWHGRLKMPREELAAILADPKVAFYTLRKDGCAEALLELDFREDGACELAYFGLTAALIGSGAGRYLMNQAIDLAWAQPIRRFHVHTCTFDSPQALPFYIRSGFTPINQRVEIADDPRLLGVLPRDAGPRIPIFEAG